MSDIEQIAPHLEALTNAIMKLTNSFSGLSGSVSRNANVTKEQDEIYEKLITSTMNLNEGITKNRSNLSNLIKTREKDLRTLQKQMRSQNAFIRAKKEAEKQILRETNSLKYYSRQMQETSRNARTMVASISGIAAVAGVSTISFNRGREALLQYNKGLFEVSRMQQLSGRTMSDLSRSFDQIKRQTSISRGEFVGLSASVNDLWLGLRPANKEIANMASTMGRQFGPGIETVTKNLERLIEIQNKLPSLAENIKEALETGDQDLAELNISTAIAAGFDRKDIEWILKAQTDVSDKQKDQISYNKAHAKQARDARDAELSMARTAEGALEMSAKAASLLYNTMAKMPAVILASAAAYRVMGSQAVYAMGQAQAGTLITAAQSMGSKFGTKGLVASMVGTGVLGSLFKGKGAAGGGTQLEFGFGGGAGVGSKAAGGVPLLSKAGIGSTLKSAATGGNLVAGVVSGGFSGVQEYRSSREEGLSRSRSATAGVTKGAGAGVGTAIGAAFGTKVFPVVGTVIGAAIGNAIGSWVGGRGAQAIRGGGAGGPSEMDISDQRRAYLEYQRASKMLEQQAKWQDQIVSSLGKQVDVARNLNVIYTSTGRTISESLREQAVELEKRKQLAEDFANIELKTTLGKLGFIDIDFGSAEVGTYEFLRQARHQIESEIQNLQAEAGSLAIKLEAGSGDENDISRRMRTAENSAKNLTSVLSMVMTHYAGIAQHEENYGNVRVAIWNKEADQISENQRLIQERINSQRELMQTTMFGLGADIGMMQKQVDMSQKIIEIEQERLQSARRVVLENQEINDAILHQVSLIEDANQLHHFAIAATDGNKDAYRELINYAKTFQEVTSKTAQETQKIYELTKEMREGYLDAVREMSFGAGEFTKIIGTQEVGVTQLMDAVASMNDGMQKLNTMAVGGQGTMANLDPSRTSIAGRYTAQFGGQFLNPEQTMGRLADIYGGIPSVLNAHSPTGQVGGAVSPEAAAAMAGERHDMFHSSSTEPRTRGVGLNNESRDATSVLIDGLTGERASNMYEESMVNALNRVGFNANRGMAAPVGTRLPSPHVRTPEQAAADVVSQAGRALRGYQDIYNRPPASGVQPPRESSPPSVSSTGLVTQGQQTGSQQRTSSGFVGMDQIMGQPGSRMAGVNPFISNEGVNIPNLHNYATRRVRGEANARRQEMADQDKEKESVAGHMIRVVDDALRDVEAIREYYPDFARNLVLTGIKVPHSDETAIKEESLDMQSMLTPEPEPIRVSRVNRVSRVSLEPVTDHNRPIVAESKMTDEQYEARQQEKEKEKELIRAAIEQRRIDRYQKGVLAEQERLGRKNTEQWVGSNIAEMSTFARDRLRVQDINKLGEGVFDSEKVRAVSDKWGFSKSQNMMQIPSVLTGGLTQGAGYTESEEVARRIEAESRRRLLTGPNAIQNRSPEAMRILSAVPELMAKVGGGMSDPSQIAAIADLHLQADQADRDRQEAINRQQEERKRAAIQQNREAGIGYYDQQGRRIVSQTEREAAQESDLRFREIGGRIIAQGGIGAEARGIYNQLQETGADEEAMRKLERRAIAASLERELPREIQAVAPVTSEPALSGRAIDNIYTLPRGRQSEKQKQEYEEEPYDFWKRRGIWGGGGSLDLIGSMVIGGARSIFQGKKGWQDEEERFKMRALQRSINRGETEEVDRVMAQREQSMLPELIRERISAGELRRLDSPLGISEVEERFLRDHAHQKVTDEMVGTTFGTNLRRGSVEGLFHSKTDTNYSDEIGAALIGRGVGIGAEGKRETKIELVIRLSDDLQSDQNAIMAQINDLVDVTFSNTFSTTP